MSDIYAATDGTAGGLGTESMPYDLDTALAAIVTGDRLIAMPGIYAQTATISTAGVTVEGHYTGRASIYGGTQITGTWSLHSGNVWKITTTTPLTASRGALILRTHSNLMLKGEYMDSLVEVIDDRQWFYTGGVMYLYSSDGDPSIAFWRIDKATLTGTPSVVYAPATAGLYIAATANSLTLRNFGVLGFLGNGLGADDANDLDVDGCDLSFNAEDGGGGFGMVDSIFRRSTANWNGTRRVRLGEIGDGDGDGWSLHDGTRDSSTNFSVRDCTFEGNCKDATQNIGGATGTVERNSIVNCGFGLVASTTGAQTFRNNVVRCGDLGITGFAVVSGTHTLHNNTFIGRDLAASTAIVSVFGAGSLTMRNNIVTRWPTGAAMLTTTFVHTYNCWDVTTLGFTLSTGEIQSEPDLIGSRFGLADTSPCLGTGTDLSATFTNDRYGRGRDTAWSMGAVEMVGITPRGRAIEALCTALEDIGDESQPWQTIDAVTRVIRAGQSTEGATAPYIALTSVSETYTRVSNSGIYDRVMKVGFVYVASDWNAFDWLGAIAHDVELAVGEDRTLGGTCHDATFQDNTSRVDGTDASVAFAIELHYRTLDNSPLTRV